MKRLLRRFLESSGVGFIALLLFIFLYAFYKFIIAPLDGLVAPVVYFLTNKEIPAIGLVILLILTFAVGEFIRNKIGWKIAEFLTRRSRILSKLLRGARSGKIQKILEALRREGDIPKPNIILAPYRRNGAPWPFIIFGIFKTTDMKYPIISGNFINPPIMLEGGTVSPDDHVYVDVSYDDAVLFAVTAGAALEDFERLPRRILMWDYLQEERVREFFNI